MFDSILVLCTGNICRSPYAEAQLRQLYPGKLVSSAGLAALVGEPADPMGVMLASERDIDLSNHVAVQVDRRAINTNDLIMVMDDGHLQQLLKRYPEARGKAFKLGHWLGDKNIGDPYQKSREFFAAVYDQIEKSAVSWQGRL